MAADGRFSKTTRIDIPLDFLRDAGAALVRTPRPAAAARSIAEPIGTTEFQQLFQSVYDAALIADDRGRVLDANPRAVQFLGYTREELCGADAGTLIHGLDDALLASILDSLQNDRYVFIHGFCARRDGSVFPAEIAASRLAVGPQRYLCFFVRDITLRRATEERLLREHHAIQNALNGIVIADLKGAIQYVNPAIRNIWAFTPEQDLAGYDIASLFTDSEAFAAILERVRGGESWVGELRTNRADETELYVQLACAPTMDTEGELLGAVFSVTDVTERKQTEIILRRYQDHLEELVRERTRELTATNDKLKVEIQERAAVEARLRDAISRLEEHDRSRSNFVFNVSHELKTPLSSMTYAVDNLLRGIVGPMPERATRYLEMMREDARRLNKTINDILDLSRVESNQLTLNPQRIPVFYFVSRTVESLRGLAGSKSQTMTVRAPEQPAFVAADPRKFERVILNVVHNAIKYTPEGGRIDVSITYRTGDRELVIGIEDSGIGIPPEFLSRVTERYFRVGDQAEGTGLGLSISKEIVELHRGVLQVVSPPPREDTGTLVNIRLPAMDPPTVLVVDDDRAIRQMLSEQLVSEGFRVVACAGGREALAQIEAGPVDMLVVDLILPEFDGVATIAEVKSRHTLRHLPIVAITGGEIGQDQQDILSGFGIPAMAKPWTKSELLYCLEKAISGRHYHET